MPPFQSSVLTIAAPRRFRAFRIGSNLWRHPSRREFWRQMMPCTTLASAPQTLLLWSAPLAWLGCGGGSGTDVVLPSLIITTSTTGVDLDPDGYSVSVDGLAAQPIGVQASVTIDRLQDGQHSVKLSGMASNCTVQGQNPSPVSVSSGATASVAFEVTCLAAGPAIGSLRSPRRPAVPRRSRRLSGKRGRGWSQPVGVNGTLTLANLCCPTHSAPS